MNNRIISILKNTTWQLLKNSIDRSIVFFFQVIGFQSLRCELLGH